MLGSGSDLLRSSGVESSGFALVYLAGAEIQLPSLSAISLVFVC